MQGIRDLSIGVFVALSLFSGAVTVHAEEDPATPSEAQTVEALVEQLGSVCPESRARAIDALVARGGASIEPLTLAMAAGSRTVRIAAAEALGRMGALAEPATPALFEALGSEDDDVAIAAVRALGSLCKSLAHVRSDLVTRLETTEDYRMAARALARAGDVVVPDLIRLMREGEHCVCLRILYYVLCEMGAPAARAVPVILPLLESEDDELRQAAEEVMEVLGAKRDLIISVLLKALDEENDSLRFSALKYLGGFQIDTPEAVHGYMRLLGDERANIRRVAANALQDAGTNAVCALDALLDALADPSPEVASAVCLALAAIGGDRNDVAAALAARLDQPGQVGDAAFESVVKCGSAAVAPLFPHLASGCPGVRARAARALGEIGPAAAEAVPQLLRATLDEHAQVAACEAILKIGEAAVPGLAESLRSREAAIRRAAADLLGSLGASALPALKPLSKALKDRDEDVRCAAATALGSIGEGAASATAPLGKLLRDKSTVVRVAAAGALGAIGEAAKRSARLLGDALGDSEQDVRFAAADALGLLGPSAKPALSDLLRSLRTQDSEVRWRVARSLGLIALPTKQVVGELENALRLDDALVRLHAVRALGSFGSKASSSVKKIEVLLVDPSKRVRAEAKAALERIRSP